MNLCGQPKCGQPQHGAGRPKDGWLNLRRTGDKDAPHGLWFCGEACLIYALTSGEVTAVATQPAITSMPDGLAALNRLAGTHLSVMTATPDRVSRALHHAFDRIVTGVRVEHARATHGRPSAEVLLAEAVGEKIETAVCATCHTERPITKFSCTEIDGRLYPAGPCRGCPEAESDPYSAAAKYARERAETA